MAKYNWRKQKRKHRERINLSKMMQLSMGYTVGRGITSNNTIIDESSFIEPSFEPSFIATVSDNTYRFVPSFITIPFASIATRDIPEIPPGEFVPGNSVWRSPADGTYHTTINQSFDLSEIRTLSRGEEINLEEYADE